MEQTVHSNQARNVMKYMVWAREQIKGEHQFVDMHTASYYPAQI